MFLDELLRIVAGRIGHVAGFGQLAFAAVFFGVLFRLALHPFDLFLAQAGRLLHFHPLFLAGAQVLGRHVQDAVGVDVELHFNLGHAARSGRDAFQVELGQQAVVASHGPFALIDLDRYGRLVVLGRAVDLLAFGGDGGVAFDQLVEQAAFDFHAQGERGHVQQQHVLHFPGQDAALDGCADGDHFVRVDPLAGLLVEDLADELLHLGHAGRTAHEHHLVDVAGRELGVAQRLLYRPAAPFHQRVDQLLELGPGDLLLQVFRAALVHDEERQVDFRFGHRGEFLLGLFAGFLQPLEGLGVFARVDTVFLLEPVRHVIHQGFIEVVAAQVRIAAGGNDAEDPLGHFQNGNVEGSAAQVEDDDFFFLLLVQTVGHRRGRGLVDNPHHLQPGNLPGVLGRLALRVVEVSRHGNHGLVDPVAQVGLGRFFELAQDVGGDLGRGVFLTADADFDELIGAAHHLVGDHLLFRFHLRPAAAHEPLDRVNGALRMQGGLTLGRVPDQHFALFGKGHYRRGDAVPFLVGDNLRFAPFHHGHDGVGRTQVDSDDFFSFRHFPAPCEVRIVASECGGNLVLPAARIRSVAAVAG